MLNKILNLIETIPEEVKECFAIIINEKDGKTLLQEINNQYIFENYKKIDSFPLSVMNIPVVIDFTGEPCLKPINKKDKYYLKLTRYLILDQETLEILTPTEKLEQEEIDLLAKLEAEDMLEFYKQENR